MKRSGDEFAFGDEVLIPWGFQDMRGTVQDVYGPPGGRHVLILLVPDESAVVDEPTTISMPVDVVRKAPSVA